MPETDSASAPDLTEDLKTVMVSSDEVRLNFTFAFGIKGTVQGVLIEYRNHYRGRWEKFPAAIYEQGDQTVADIMHMLATMRAEGRQ